MQLADAQKLAKDLMQQHGLINNELGSPNWRFEFDRSVRRFGACHYNQRKITISAELTARNVEARVRDTLLHEIAHALAGHKAGHGLQWQNICRAIGGDGQRTYSAANTVTVGHKVTGRCTNCGRVIKRHRRSNIACGQCCARYNGGKYDEKYKIVWQRG